jgi:SAM-dependent methyltransferase
MSRGDPTFFKELGADQARSGRLGDAAATLMSALALAPKDPDIVRLLGRVAGAIAAGAPARIAPPAAESLLAVLACDRLDHQHFIAPCLAYLRGPSPLGRAFAILADRGADAAADWLLGTGGKAARTDPVLIAALGAMVFPDADLEALLTALRRRVLLDGLYRPGRLTAELLAALARHCGLNEHVWAETDAEIDAAAALDAHIRDSLAGRRRLGGDLLALLLYRSPESLPDGVWATSRDAPSLEPAARRLIDELAAVRREERTIAAALPRLTATADPVSLAVARQYEDNPYPRWRSLTPPDPGGDGAGLDILIAGCGTGRQAVSAAFGYGTEARLLAVDLSRAALAHAGRMARRFQRANLRYAQADILALNTVADLGPFDVIECMGVLHHLADPLAGWRVLAGLLKPGGTLRIALYSARARAGIAAARDRIAALGLGTDAGSIRRFRQEMLADTGRLRQLALSSLDTFTLSGTRDLLFHVQEHRFTPLDIADRLEALDLIFAGMLLPADRIRSLMAEVAGDPLDLAAWDAVERRHPDLFQGMIRFDCRPAAP